MKRLWVVPILCATAAACSTGAGVAPTTSNVIPTASGAEIRAGRRPNVKIVEIPVPGETASPEPWYLGKIAIGPNGAVYFRSSSSGVAGRYAFRKFTFTQPWTGGGFTPFNSAGLNITVTPGGVVYWDCNYMYQQGEEVYSFTEKGANGGTAAEGPYNLEEGPPIYSDFLANGTTLWTEGTPWGGNPNYLVVDYTSGKNWEQWYRDEFTNFAIGPDGAMWASGADATGADPMDLHAEIARFAVDGNVSTVGYPVNVAVSRHAINSQNVWGLTAGRDGALWFTDVTNNTIGRMTTSGSVTEYPIPTANATPARITKAPDGALWFTEFTGNKIGRITTSGAITEYTIPTPDAQPFGIAASPSKSSANPRGIYFREQSKIGFIAM